MNYKPKSALEFEKEYPEIQTKQAKISQLQAITFNMPVLGTTKILPNSGDVALQTNGGSVTLAVTLGTVTYLFSPSGTIIS